MTWSAIPATTARSCEIRSSPLPASTRRRSVSSTCRCTVTSSAVVGSSAMISRGFAAIAEAMSARWRSPPDSSCGCWSMRSSARGTPTCSSSSIARARDAWRGTMWWVCSTSAISAPTVRSGSRETSASCSTMPICPPRTRRQSVSLKDRASRPPMSSRSAETRPFGPSSPRRVRAVTDLPDPDSPTIATHCPGRTENDTPLTTVVRGARFAGAPKLTERFSTATRGSQFTRISCPRRAGTSGRRS